MHNTFAYNTAHFFFTITQCPNINFNVIKMNGDESLSNDYKFIISVTSDSAIDNLSLIGTNAILSWNSYEQFISRHGIISHFISEGINNDYYFYTFTLHSPLYPLRLSCHNQTFHNQDIINIISNILQLNDWAEYTYRFFLTKKIPKIVFVAHLNQSDFEFIHTLIAHFDLIYYFEQSQNYAILIITDNAANLTCTQEINLSFQPQTTLNLNSSSVYSLQNETALLSDHFKLNDYNYLEPDINLKVSSRNSSDIQGMGYISLHNQNYENTLDGIIIATSLQQQLDCQRFYFTAQSNYRDLILGLNIKLHNHPQNEWKTRYKIISISHEIEQDSTSLIDDIHKNFGYRNTLKLLEHSLLSYQRPISKTLPIFNGSMFGIIIAEDFNHAAVIDEYGRYNVLLPFTDNKNLITAPLRLLQYHGGNHPNNERYGWHFPLSVGTIVLLSFINGNLNCPVILGITPNRFMTSPVNSNNHTQNKITTLSDNQILFEEQQGLQKILFKTPQQSNSLLLDATQKNHKIEFTSQQGLLQLNAKNNIHQQTQDTINSNSQGSCRVNVTNGQQLITRQKSLHLQSGNDLKFNAQNNIHLLSENGAINLSSQQNFGLQAKGSFTLRTQHDNLNFQLLQGKISCIGFQNIKLHCINSGDILLKQGDSIINLDNNGNTFMRANKIYINAPKICLGKIVLLNGQPL